MLCLQCIIKRKDEIIRRMVVVASQESRDEKEVVVWLTWFNCVG